jgi:hypothetical protein
MFVKWTLPAGDKAEAMSPADKFFGALYRKL